jgi:large subunit ribosomal protein L13
MKTFSATPKDISRDWFLVDAQGKTLGRLASEIARRLRGKHKPSFTPNMDTGDNIVVINARDIRVTGRKVTNKLYYRHSGYPSGIKSVTLGKLLQTKPELVIEKAVKGMLPRGPLGRAMFRKLHVYPGNTHKHTAQQPKTLEI